MQQIVMFPSEALLLGLCIGEYELGHRETRFVSVMRLRLIPLYADSPFSDLEEGESVQLPLSDDVEWTSGYFGYRLGVTQSEPDVIYFWKVREDTCHKYRCQKPAERPFIWDLLERLRRYVAVTVREATFHGIPANISFRDAWVCVFSREKTAAHTEVLIGKDFRRAIISTVEKLAAENDYDRLFDTGRSFGRLLSLLFSYLEHVETGDPDNEHDSFIEFAPNAKELTEKLSNAISWRSPFAKRALEFLSKLDLSPQPTQIYDELETQAIMMMFWIAFADVMREIAIDDEKVRQGDAESPTPRSFQLTGNEEPDVIRKRVGIAERHLAEEREQSENIVTLTNPAIEALCKRMWGGSFEVSGKNIQDQIHGAERGSDQQRFASIARALYLNYRNPSVHQMESFRCSNREAKFFLSGIHAMLDLLESAAD